MRRVALASLISTLIVFVLGAIAVAQQDPTRPPPSPQPRDPAQQLSPQDRARRAKVVARVGEVRITIGDVEDAINEQSPVLRARYRDDPARVRELVDGLVRFELLARAAERAGIGNDQEVRQSVKQTSVQQLIRRDFDERITTESIPAEDVRAYYTAHPDEFTRDELRRAAHILVASREEAERLLGQVRAADAARFRELAQEHSLDVETRLRGGDLRFFDREGHARNTRDPQVHEAIAAAAFALAEVGDVSAAPVQVGERWSVVKLTGRRPAEHRTLEQAEPSIRLRLWRERRQGSLDDFVNGLRERANVQVDYDLLRPIRLDPPAREDAEEDEEAHGAAATDPHTGPVPSP